MNVGNVGDETYFSIQRRRVISFNPMMLKEQNNQMFVNIQIYIC